MNKHYLTFYMYLAIWSTNKIFRGQKTYAYRIKKGHMHRCIFSFIIIAHIEYDITKIYRVSKFTCEEECLIDMSLKKFEWMYIVWNVTWVFWVSFTRVDDFQIYISKHYCVESYTWDTYETIYHRWGWYVFSLLLFWFNLIWISIHLFCWINEDSVTHKICMLNKSNIISLSHLILQNLKFFNDQIIIKILIEDIPYNCHTIRNENNAV